MPAKGYCNLGFARVDTDRKKRKGFPEVIYAPGKTLTHLRSISKEIIRHRNDLIITRIDEKNYGFLKEGIPGLKYSPLAKIAYLKQTKKTQGNGFILVVTGGTSDIPVAEEAALTSEIMGCKVKRLFDVGVAGVHRVIDKKHLLKKAKVIIVIAGMEGALASIVSGMASSVVIAVPTSIGYGASFKGVAALLTMLNSCSPGVAVVNIDNGFGAGYLAAMIYRSKNE